MADRFTDERDRDWRDRDWQRSERYGRGQDRDRNRSSGQQGYQTGQYGRDDEDRTFAPRSGPNNDDGRFGSSDFSGSRYGAEGRYGGRNQSGYQGGQGGSQGYGGGQASGGQDRSRFGARFEGPDRDRVFGERERGDDYRPSGSSQSSSGNYGGSPEYGREPGRTGQAFGGGGSYGAYGSGGGQRQYGQGGQHFGQPYGDEHGRPRSSQDYSSGDAGSDYGRGGRYYGDDGQERLYREEYGQGGREYGSVPRGYDAPQWRGGAESYGGRSGATSYGSGGSQNPGERWSNRDEREHHTPNVREGRGEGGRSWWDRTRDQVASFFGDNDAHRRSDWDRQSGGYQSEGHRGRGPKGYKRSDERINEEVNQRLTDDPWVDASNIDVSVKSCEVTLSGTVSDREERRRAERVVEDIWGVTHVQNNLRVQERTGQGLGGENPRDGAGSMLGRGSSDTSSRNPITGTGHGLGDNQSDAVATGAASLADPLNTGAVGQPTSLTSSSANGSSATGSDAQTTSQSGSGKDRNK
ncbi:MAG: BON domain-containing protein [Phenylobacterium sp.]